MLGNERWIYKSGRTGPAVLMGLPRLYLEVHVDSVERDQIDFEINVIYKSDQLHWFWSNILYSTVSRECVTTSSEYTHEFQRILSVFYLRSCCIQRKELQYVWIQEKSQNTKSFKELYWKNYEQLKGNYHSWKQIGFREPDTSTDNYEGHI